MIEVCALDEKSRLGDEQVLVDQPYAIRGEPHFMRVQVPVAVSDFAPDDLVALHARVLENVYPVVERSEESYLDLG